MLGMFGACFGYVRWDYMMCIIYHFFIAIGNVTSLDRKSPSVAETEIGVGSTCAWALGGLDPSSTVALYFEVRMLICRIMRCLIILCHVMSCHVR